MTPPALKRILANAINRRCVCFNDELYIEAVLALLVQLDKRFDELPSWLRKLVERVERAEEWV